jgi:hypothetical protein
VNHGIPGKHGKREATTPNPNPNLPFPWMMEDYNYGLRFKPEVSLSVFSVCSVVGERL